MTSQLIYDNADKVRPGDYLPDVSRGKVSIIIISPHKSVRIVFDTGYTALRPYGGPQYGYRVERIIRDVTRLD